MKVKQNNVHNVHLPPFMPAVVAVFTGLILWCAEGFQQKADLKNPLDYMKYYLEPVKRIKLCEEHM